MIERIRQIGSETAWILTEIIGNNFGVERALTRLQATLDDLEAVSDPSDDQVDTVFVALVALQSKLMDSLAKVSQQHQPLLENLTDRIDIFLFHHRL